MKIKNLGEGNSVINNFISELRNVDIQNDRFRFRKNLERLGEIFAYEISKTLEYKSETVVTPLGSLEMNVLKEQPVLATILRAGLPMHQGFLNIFDKADNSFIAAHRKYDKNENYDINIEYYSTADFNDKVLVVIDPMLSTGESLVRCLNDLISDDMMPKEIHVANVLASRDGIEYLNRSLNHLNITVWVGAIDEELTAKAYIVPGLGDAGDLAYGKKEK
ncbi:MAG: uracil phosphoribosyltransferase [Bacteroidales bacterium]|nr:uracil phosphoribosyltransferase [Bacteroidales bacterium]